jgi:sec-independent protein translocase protein TatA
MNHGILLGWFGQTEIIVIAIVVLLLFGGRKIPELMKGVGKGIRNFKEGVREGAEEPPARKDNEQLDDHRDEKP